MTAPQMKSCALPLRGRTVLRCRPMGASQENHVEGDRSSFAELAASVAACAASCTLCPVSEIVCDASESVCVAALATDAAEPAAPETADAAEDSALPTEETSRMTHQRTSPAVPRTMTVGSVNEGPAFLLMRLP